MDMVFFQQVLFTFALWFLVFVILAMFSRNLSVTAVASSSNTDNKKKDLARKYDVVGENLNDDSNIIGTKASVDMIKKNEQVVSKEKWDTCYVKQNVGACGDDKSCYLMPRFHEFEVKSMYYVEEVQEEPDFQETENNPSEKNEVKKQGGDDVFVEKDEGLLGEWEGVERTELEKLFGAAVVFVDSMKNGDVLDNELKMQLYGLHKVATEGPCYGRRPMTFKLSARAKWSSWHGLGDMKREKAMEQYVALLSDRVADWKIDKTDGNYELISPDAETSQDSRHFFTQVAR